MNVNKKNRFTPETSLKFIELSPRNNVKEKHLTFSYIVNPLEYISIPLNAIYVKYRWRIPNPTYDANSTDADKRNPYIYITKSTKTFSNKESPADQQKLDYQQNYLVPECGASSFFETAYFEVNQRPVKIDELFSFQYQYQGINRMFVNSPDKFKELFGSADDTHFFTKEDENNTQKMTSLQERQFDMMFTDQETARSIIETTQLDGIFPFSNRASIPELFMKDQLSKKFKKPVTFPPRTKLFFRLSQRDHIEAEVLQRMDTSWTDWIKNDALKPLSRDIQLEILDVKIAYLSHSLKNGQRIPRHIGINYAFAPKMSLISLPSKTAHTTVPIFLPPKTQFFFLAFMPNQFLLTDPSKNKPLSIKLRFPEALTKLKVRLSGDDILLQEFENLGSWKASESSSNIQYFQYLHSNHLAPFTQDDYFPKSLTAISYCQALIFDLRPYNLTYDRYLNVEMWFDAYNLSPANHSIMTLSWVPVQIETRPDEDPIITELVKSTISSMVTGI